MRPLLEQVEKSTQTRKLFRRGQSILVAVSGGVDSMVLLHLLHQLSHRHDWRLTVAHFNHQLRGAASDADEKLVQVAARRLGLEFVSERGDVRGHQLKTKLSLEMAARGLRHGFLREAAERLKVGTVALAHHADDQAELFLLRLLRGAGGRGLSGMKWSNPSPVSPQLQLVRPLLGHAKAEIKAFARANRIRFREDASNRSVDMLRNRIRRELLPLLAAKYETSVVPVILRTMEIIEAESAFVEQAAERWLKRKRPASFEGLHPAVQRQCLRIQLNDLFITATFDLIERLRTVPDQSVSVSRAFRVFRDQRGWVHRQNVAAKKAGFNPNETVCELTAAGGGRRFDGVDIHWLIVPQTGRLPGLVPRPGQEWLDADKVGAFVCLRHWRAGDRFQPIGLEQPVKLQDLFTNLKIPREQRRELLVAEELSGRIFWVEGLRISEQFKLDKATGRVVKWQWRRLTGQTCSGGTVVAGGRAAC